MNDAISLLALVGATLIVVRGTIFDRVRRLWPALLECSQCTGTWVGIIAGASGVVTTGHGRILDAAVVGAATSVASMLVDALLLMMLGKPESKGPQ